MSSLLTEKEQMEYAKIKEKALKELEIRNIKNEIKEINRKGSRKERLNYFLASSTSKLMMTYIFVLCTVITIYAMIVMYLKEDLSALPILITAVVGETISYAIYSVKAYKGKKSEVDAQLERDKFEWEKSETEAMYSDSEIEEESDTEG